jgi:hypothetical protein
MSCVGEDVAAAVQLAIVNGRCVMTSSRLAVALRPWSALRELEHKGEGKCFRFGYTEVPGEDLNKGLRHK